MRDLTCARIMIREVLTLRETDSVSQAARLMRDNEVGFAPVLNAASHVVGVLTDRDLAMRVLADEKPADTPVGHVMSRNLVSVRAQEHLRAAEDKMMMFKVQRLPVLNDDKTLAGVLSVADLAKAGEDGETAVIVSTRSHAQLPRKR